MRRMLDGNLGDGVDSRRGGGVRVAHHRRRRDARVRRRGAHGAHLRRDQGELGRAGGGGRSERVRGQVQRGVVRGGARSSRDGERRLPSILLREAGGDARAQALPRGVQVSEIFRHGRATASAGHPRHQDDAQRPTGVGRRFGGFDRARVALEAGGEGDGRVRGADESRALANRGTRGDVQGAPPGRIRRGFPRGVRTQGDEKDGSGGGGGRDRAEAHRGRARRRRRRGTESDGRGGGSGEGFSSPSKTRPPAPPRTTTATAAAISNPPWSRFPVDRFLGRAAAAGTQHKRTGSGGLAGMSGWAASG